MKKTKKIILSLVMIMCLFLTSACGSSKSEDEGSNTTSGTNTNSSSNSKSSSEKLSVTTSAEVAKSGDLIVYITNDEKTTVDVDVEVEFYDADGKIVGTDEFYLNGIKSGTTTASEAYNSTDDWESYKVYADAEETIYTSYLSEVSETHNDNKEEIIVQVSNDSEDEINTISASVVFYKGDEVVGISEDSDFDIKSGRTANLTFYYPYDKNYDDLDFDTYKVYINEAYTY